MTTALGVPSQPPSSANDSHAGESKHTTSLATYPDDGLSAFLRARPRLFGIAYRMLGSAAEAEDIVQDVWVRWQTTDRSPVRNPLAFLVDRDHATRDQRAPVRSRAQRDLCRPMAAGAGRHQHRSGLEGRAGRGVERLRCCFCWRSSRQPSARRTCFERPSTIPTGRLQTSFGSKKPTRGSSSPERGSMCRADSARP